MALNETRPKVGSMIESCMLCGTPTFGSIGAAGIRWKKICQPCKDKEDRALAAQIEHQSKLLNLAFNGFVKEV